MFGFVNELAEHSSAEQGVDILQSEPFTIVKDGLF